MSTYRVDIRDQQYNWKETDIDNLDIIDLKSGSYQVIQDGKTYSITVVSHDLECKSIRLRVNGRLHYVTIKDTYDQVVDKMGLEVGTAAAVGDVMAPMPGLVLDILVKDGDTVEQGTPLLLLEAMKMENVIKAQGEGVIDLIKTSKGAAVEKGQLLITMVTP